MAEREDDGLIQGRDPKRVAEQQDALIELLKVALPFVFGLILLSQFFKFD